MEAKEMKPQIGLNEQSRNKVGRILNRILADEYVLLVKTKSYHWNIVGPNFSELHKFFDSQYEELGGFADEAAERSRSLGVRAAGSMAELVGTATIKEDRSQRAPDQKTMVKNLLRDHEAMIVNLRKDLEDCAGPYRDMGTSDFLTGLMENHEKMAWMLRSYLL
jgi:starvation-inducible DNA-binding protein